MLVRTYAARDLAAEGLKQSSHKKGEIAYVGTYATRGQGPLRASHQRL